MANSRTSYLWRRLAVIGLFAVAWSPLSVVSGSSSSSTMTSSTMQRDSVTCADGGPDTLEQSEPSFSVDTSEVIVRFFFIRHAQTEANDELIVVGQGDSPLTVDGMKQARALGKTDLIRKEPFWRRYSSDLGRAQKTTRLILSNDLAPIESLGVTLEPRLRELAKGAREGLLKKLSYEEAKVIFRQRHGPDAPFPLLETEEAVWERTKDWLLEVIGDAVRDYRQQSDKRPKVYSVFVVLHAGTLRTALKYLVPEQMPETVDLSTQTFDGSTSKHLKVPNTSVTIVDIALLEPQNEIWDKERTSQRLASNFADLWLAKLQQLTWTDHYQLVE